MLGRYTQNRGSYNRLGYFGDYNSDIQRLKGLVGGRNQSNLRTISDLSASLADQTRNQRLKDDLNTIALESHDFESYGPTAWTRWWGYLSSIESVAPEAINPPSSSTSSGSGSGSSTSSDSGGGAPAGESKTMLYLGIGVAVTIAGIAIYYYTTGAA